MRSNRERVRRIVWHPVTEIVIVALIIVSVTLMVVEATLPPGHPAIFHLEFWGHIITWVFAFELALRWYVLRSLGRFLGSYWIDVLAVAPLLRPLRILRVLRVLRILRLFRAGLLLNRWMSRVQSTFVQGYREYLVVAAIAATLVLTGGMSIWFLERHANPALSTFRKAIWWATYTMMAGEPVGGEPVTTAGRVVLVAMMMGGMTVFALLTGVISALMVERLKCTMEGRVMELDDLNDHILVCGWNRGGPVLISELARDERHAHRAIVLITESPPDGLAIPFEEVDRERVYVVSQDYTRVSVLEEAGVRRASMAILLADKTGERADQDRDARTVLAALTIENLNPCIFSCVELLHEENAQALRLAGVEEIVIATEYSGTIMAHASLNAGLVRLFNEVLTSSYGNNFYKAEVPPDWVDRCFPDCMNLLKREHGGILLSAERPGEDGHWETSVNPDESYVFGSEERIVYLAPRRLELE